jgi:superfamily II DNA or RNA helicase
MSSTKQQGIYIIPQSHPAGVLFPSWIAYNYGRFKMDKMIVEEGVDPCTAQQDKLKLRNYQSFLEKYMTYESPFREILIYHAPGTGKTCTSIQIYNTLFNSDERWNVFVLLKKSLIGNWNQELDKCLEKTDNSFSKRRKNIVFINYDAPNANEQFLRITKEKYQNGNKSVFIIDEVHNFISAVYGNIKNQKKGKRDIYDQIIMHKKSKKFTRIILLSATPAINRPFELALLYNLLRPGAFPTTEADFDDMFITDIDVNPRLKPENRNLFMRRILGLTSYYAGASKGLYASKEVIEVKLKFPEYMREVYDVFKKKEDDMERSKQPTGMIVFRILKADANRTSIYKAYTRTVSDFVFPKVDNKFNGEMRPRPSMFRIDEKDVEDVEKRTQNEKRVFTLKGKEYRKYQDAAKNFISMLIDYWTKLLKEDIKAKYTLDNDVKAIDEKYKGDSEAYYFSKDRQSKLFYSMYTSSPKMIHIVLKLNNSPGPALVYSNYVNMEGLEAFKIYLRFFGYKSYKDKGTRDFHAYAEYHGGIKEQSMREAGRNAFNKPENKYGKKIKVILISPAGSEGISLMNVRTVHILEPHWNEVRIEQIVGRAIRLCSHKDLPMKERHVKAYRYKMSFFDELNPTTDEFIEEVSKKKLRLISSFTDAVKEVAIDCALFKDVNMDIKEYKCFKFDEESQLSKELGYVYKSRIQDELGKPGKGMYSLLSDTVLVETKKIKAVLGNDKSKHVDFYWLYPEKGYAYHYDLEYLVGRVKYDEDGIPEMFDKDTYLIGELVPLKDYTINIDQKGST